VEELEKERLSLTAQLEKARVDIAEQKEGAFHVSTRMGEWETERLSLVSQLEEARTEATKQRGAATHAEGRVEEREAECSSFAAQVERGQMGIKTKQEEVNLAETKARDLEWELDMERKRTQNLAAQLKQHGDTVQALRDGLAESKSKESQLQQLVNAQEAKEKEWEAEMATVLEELEVKESALATVSESYEIARKGGDVVKALESKLQECQSDVAALKGRLKLQEGLIGKAQDEAKHRMKDDREEKKDMADDETLKHRLRVDVEEAARQWADRYALQDVPAELDDSAYDAMRNEFGAISGGGNLAPLCRRYGPDILVHAMLSHFVTEAVLSKPFLLFQLEGGQRLAERMAKWYQGQRDGEWSPSHGPLPGVEMSD
jgi:chromosome segregation ATPase